MLCWEFLYSNWEYLLSDIYSYCILSLCYDAYSILYMHISRIAHNTHTYTYIPHTYTHIGIHTHTYRTHIHIHVCTQARTRTCAIP
jgi:hypothetical protein